MAFATVMSRTQFGLESPLVTIEVHLSQGLPAFHIVGMPEVAVKESRDRVRSALINANFEFPMQRITVNLAPADVPKQGSRFDLAIAVCILVANGDLPQSAVNNIEFISELGLSGQLRPVNGLLSSLLYCEKEGHSFVGCAENSTEVFFEPQTKMYFLNALTEVYQLLQGSEQFALFKPDLITKNHLSDSKVDNVDIADVKGQMLAKKALLVSAAGRHNVLFFGPPGSGKTMLCNRMQSILPDLKKDDALETARIYSCADEKVDARRWQKPPFRKPHHSASPTAIIGGGRVPTPGEISLANHGVLFLDEIAEFNRSVLEHLREPLESGEISISRAQWKITFPAKIQLLATMNPCPCGYYHSQMQECRCSSEMVKRYQAKLSGPIRDRMDIIVHMDAVPTEDLIQYSSPDTGYNSANLMKQVMNARHIQYQRQNCLNGMLTNQQVEKICEMENDASVLMHAALEKLNISARLYFRLVKVSQTLADLQQNKKITASNISEAINFHRVTF